jgi:hypothetical protein
MNLGHGDTFGWQPESVPSGLWVLLQTVGCGESRRPPRIVLGGGRNVPF